MGPLRSRSHCALRGLSVASGGCVATSVTSQALYPSFFSISTGIDGQVRQVPHFDSIVPLALSLARPPILSLDRPQQHNTTSDTMTEI